MLAASYGLLNANAKLQFKSDKAITSLGMLHYSSIPQLFLHFNAKKDVNMVLIKIVDDVFATGTNDTLKQFVNNFGCELNLGELTHGPGTLRYFGLNIIQ